MAQVRATKITWWLSLWVLSSCGQPPAGRFCFGDGLCVEPDGQKVLEDGRPLCELTGTCDDSNPTDTDTDSDADTDPGDTGPGSAACTCTVTSTDSDGDCIPNSVETNGTWVDDGDNCFEPLVDTAGGTDPNNEDSDGDGVWDGCEDRNRNGTFDIGEMVAFSNDTDCDGIPDGIEDGNHNGIFEFPSESNPRRADSDGDGVPDGDEDINLNGVVDPWVDTNGNGCWDLGVDTPGEASPKSVDSDGDGILDQAEDKNKNGACDVGETCVWLADTDCDLLPDGQEDINHNGIRNTGESDPLNADTDNDGIEDGSEDSNLNGHFDVGTETNPLSNDSDGDGILDGTEDLNGDGIRQTFGDLNGNGCWDDGEPPGESDPRVRDTDGDGVPDDFEDRDKDGACRVDLYPDPLTGDLVRTFFETCMFLADTDCDGVNDGQEDVNRNGTFEPGELNPRYVDTDNDGLADGCNPSTEAVYCEDKNNNGLLDSGETDPRRPDTDGDLLTDGCEINFSPANCTSNCGGTLPLFEDTDGDGDTDGEEDGNHNCVFEPGVSNCDTQGNCRNETDPRVAEPPPASGTLESARFNVCATQNLKKLTFAESLRTTHDYRLAFEVEAVDTGGVCTNGQDFQCGPQELCENDKCIKKSQYIVKAYGEDSGGNGFDANDTSDSLLGHVFQSNRGVIVDPGTQQPVNRDLYGFTLFIEEPGSVEDLLDSVRTNLQASSTFQTVEETGVLVARPAHDSLPNFRVTFAQRSLSLTLPSAGKNSALEVRRHVLVDRLLTLLVDPGLTSVDPADALPTVDPVYGSINCGQNPNLPTCYQNFTMYISAVQRLDQTAPSGNQGVVVLAVALTPDDSSSSVLQARLYNDRVARIEDLTGGSALARFEATTGKICEQKDPKKAVADILWVVDDSKSMQRIIGKLQQASRDARAVLTANAGIVDFRVAMTTTNPSPTARVQCPASCASDCSGGSCQASCDNFLGCYNICPPFCTTGCGDSSGTCATGCVNPCALPSAIDGIVSADTTHQLPGGGGSFYFEDTQYLDCFGRGTSSLEVNHCGAACFSSEFSQFFNGGLARKQLTGNEGFLGSSATCPVSYVDLNASTKSAAIETTSDGTVSCSDISGPSCTSENVTCCARLIDSCSDGPTVLGSQMCDLIRAMGGLPQIGVGSGGSARPHSAPENGSRSARRTLQTMIPALPKDQAGPGSLRLSCNSTDGTCLSCDPRTDGDCDIVPMVTIMLSDEEDFWFKDDCRRADFGSHEGETDHWQLPDRCYWRDNDPNTSESCNPCDDLPVRACTVIGDCDPTYQAGSQCVNGLCTCNPAAYCNAGLFAANLTSPNGTNHDLAAYEQDRSFSLEWYSGTTVPTECDPASLTATCAADPCKAQPDDTSCDAITVNGAPYCFWTGSSCFNRCEARSRCPPTQCIDGSLACAAGGGCPGAGQDNAWIAETQNRCDNDPLCVWVPGQVDVSQGRNATYACQPKYPINDCQGCKRLTRRLEAVEGGVWGRCTVDNTLCTSDGECLSGACTRNPGICNGDAAACTSDAACTDTCTRRCSGNDAVCNINADCSALTCASNQCVNGDPCTTNADCQVCAAPSCDNGLSCSTNADCRHCVNMIGFGDLGPVYSIIREKGVQAFGGTTTPTSQDACQGGQGTWGLGDGQGYRDLAIDTLGRTQNVCATSYLDFMGLLVSDIAALSAPYPLIGTPIASTIKVGIARPNGLGGFTYIDVPRSRTRGFFYSATGNTLAFKSDPIDGDCGGGACSANGVTENEEILFAQTAVTVPKDNDQIFISYRFWRPVPCLEQCADNETCVTLVCSNENSTGPACPGQTDLECPGGYKCLSGECRCILGDLVNACITDVTCGICKVFNEQTGQCDDAPDDPNGCPQQTRPGACHACQKASRERHP